MILLSGDNPLVMCSGWSVNALRNPFLFFSRYSRTMKASRTNGLILWHHIRSRPRADEGELLFGAQMVERSLLCMHNHYASNHVNRYMVLEHVDHQDPRGDGHQASSIVQRVSILPQDELRS